MQKDGGCAERWWLYAERLRLNATPHETIQDGGCAERWWLYAERLRLNATPHETISYFETSENS